MTSVFLLATCDLDKVTGAKSEGQNSTGIDSTELTLSASGTTLGSLALGQQSTVTVTSTTADLEGVSKRYYTSAPSVISIDSVTGLMTGLQIGVSRITAKIFAPELGEGVRRSEDFTVRYNSIKITTPTLPDSLTGLGQTRTVVVQGQNVAGTNQGALSTGVVVSSKDTTILSVTGATAKARKNGTTYIVATYDGLRDSVALKVRRVARRIAFPTTDYTINTLCTGACPNGGRLVPFSAFDIADTLIVGPTATWRVLNTSTANINATTGVLKVISLDTANRVLVKVDTVERGQRILVQQVVGKVARFAGDSQTAEVASLVGIAPQVVVTDSGDTPMAGVTVTFAVTAGGGSVTGATVVTDANGRAAVGSWRLGTVAGNAQTLTATAGTASFSFTATSTPGPAARLAFGVQPAGAGAGAVMSPSITVRVTDTLSNLVTAGSSSVTLALLSNPGAASLGGTVTRTTTNGVATFNDITVSATGAGYTLQATAASLATAASNAFDVFGAANKLAFIVQPSNSVVNQAISPAVKVAIQDVNGLTVTSATNTIALSVVAGPSSVLNGVITTAAVNGVATFSSASLPVAGSGYQIRAAASPALANNTVTSNAFTVAAIGPAVKLGFSIQPSDATAGFTISPATGIRVAIQDANGATVTTASATITLSFETNAGNGTLTGTLTQATSSGVAIFSGLSINKSGVSYKLRADASGGTLTSATSNAFNITTGTVTKLRFEQQPTATVAATAMVPAVKVALADVNDNTSTTSSTNVTLTLNSCSTLTGGTSTPTSSGVATFSSVAISNTGANCTLTASGSGFTATSSPFNVVATGGATKIAFISSTPTVTSGQPMQWQVELQNGAGARVTTATASITVAIGNNAGGGTLGGTTTLTTSQGLATFSSLVIGAAGTGYTLVANATGYATATSSSFNVVPSAAKKVAFLTQPSNAVAGINLSPSPRVAIQDSAGNTVTSATTPVLMSFNTNPGGGAISGTTLVTPVNGIATFDNVRIARSATGYSFIASVPNTSLTNAISSSFNITVGTPFGFMFTAQPVNATAGATMASVQVQIVDEQGNSVTTATNPITLALSGGTGGAVLNGTTTQTPVSGLATFSNLSVNTQGSAYRLNASASGLTASQSNTFDITVGAPTKLLFKTQPSVMTTGAQSTFTVAITDASNNTVTGASANITLGIFSGPGILGGTLTQATNNGVATFSNITLNTAGSVVLQATSSPAFTAAQSSAITVANQQLQISSGNNQTGTVGSNVAANPVVVVRDGAGNPVAGIQVTFTTTGNGTLNNTSATSVSPTSDGGGLVSVIWKLRTTSGPDTLKAALTGTPGVFVLFTATGNPGTAAAILKNAGDAQTAVVSTAVAIAPQVKVADSFGNGISGANVTFSVLSGGGSITGGTTTTNAAGFASVGSWTLGSAAGSNSLQAQSGAFTTTFAATATTSDPCTVYVAHAIGATSNGSLDTADCGGPTTPRDQFNVTTSSANTFFSATLASSVFTPNQYAKVWAPAANRLGLSTGTGSVTLYYLLATAGTYEIDVEKASGSTGAYTLSSVLNPSVPSTCVSIIVTKGISATQSLSSSCTSVHDSLSSIPGRTTSTRYYYIWQPASTTITVRMNAGTITDPYLEASDLSGLLLAYNDDDTSLSSLMTIPSNSVGRFVEIRAMHYTPSGGSALSGDFTLIIDP